MTKLNYLMEHPDEAKRLHIKSSREKTFAQLLSTHLEDLPECPTLVDAGCGGGFVSEILLDFLIHKRPGGTLLFLDGSEERLNEAERYLKDTHPGAKVPFKRVCCNLEAVSLEAGSVDYVFSRFVFEYLPNPTQALREFKRILKPGGRIAIGDLDYNCLSHYPLKPELESQLLQITRQLEDKKLLDPYIGRKLYTMAYHENFKELEVQVLPHHLFYGALPESEHYNWTSKLDQMVRLQKAGTLNLDFDASLFRAEFMAYLTREDRFTYTPLILVAGVKP